MRILWLTPEIPFPSDNGHRFLCGNRIAGMASIGHEIHLRAFAENNDEFLRIHPALKSCAKSIKLFERIPSSSLRAIPFFTPRHIFKRSCEELRTDVHKLLTLETFDAIIIDSINMAQYLSPSLPKQTISVLNVHNLDYRIFLRSALVQKKVLKSINFTVEGIKTWLYENRVYSRNAFDVFTFVSKTELEVVKRRHSYIRAELAPIGVGNNAIRLPILQNQCRHLTIAFIGNLSYFSNVESISWFVNSVYPLILRQVPNVNLIISGKDPCAEILQLVSQNGRIRLFANVSDVVSVYSLADVIIAPIISGAGVKVKVLEALSYRKPVVATELAIDGTDLLPGQHVLMAKKNCVDEFAKKCVELLYNAKVRDNLSKAGYDFVLQRYDWSILNQAYEKLIRQAIEIKEKVRQ